MFDFEALQTTIHHAASKQNKNYVLQRTLLPAANTSQQTVIMSNTTHGAAMEDPTDPGKSYNQILGGNIYYNPNKAEASNHQANPKAAAMQQHIRNEEGQHRPKGRYGRHDTWVAEVHPTEHNALISEDTIEEAHRKTNEANRILMKTGPIALENEHKKERSRPILE
eukprot:GEZU01028984.1.p1 GENE.GEZU01028984.1~~GEZU01028984.1.p1  ORF type:complete len:180 (-),score=41.05 GEZU01028984.1:64-564(-)